MILDAGCGDRPKGDVNIDLFTGKTNQRDSGRELNPKLIPNFVKATVEFLPFHDDAFASALCFHALEHLNNPMKAICELLRVSRHIIIKTPHRLSRHACLNPTHKRTFNKKSFAKALAKIKKTIPLTFIMTYSTYDKFPFVLMPIIQIPQEITVEIWKQRRCSKD